MIVARNLFTHSGTPFSLCWPCSFLFKIGEMERDKRHFKFEKKKKTPNQHAQFWRRQNKRIFSFFIRQPLGSFSNGTCHGDNSETKLPSPVITSSAFYQQTCRGRLFPIVKWRRMKNKKAIFIHKTVWVFSLPPIIGASGQMPLGPQKFLLAQEEHFACFVRLALDFMCRNRLPPSDWIREAAFNSSQIRKKRNATAIAPCLDE